MPRVLVCGSSNTDMTVRVPELPAAGQTVLGDSFAVSPGGKGANQAVAARRAGGDVVFVTAVGGDELGRQALALYGREGIDVQHVKVVPDQASGVALIHVGPGGENMIAVASGANLLLSPSDVDRLPASLFQPGDILLAGLEIPIPTAIRAMRRGKEAGMTVVLNPAPVPSLSEREVGLLLAVADVVTPNRVEALMLAGVGGGRPDPANCARKLLALGPGAVLITLGAEGCLAASPEGHQMITAPRVAAVDTVGAGDAFNGALAVALVEGKPLMEAVHWAVHAASLATTKPGAQTALPHRNEIEEFLHARPSV